jgi:hypothetical protein
METAGFKKKLDKNIGDKALRVRKKAASASSNESSVASELKNSEHGNEKPAR